MFGIYEPKGKAGEYAPLAVNLFKGCSHGCKYCYAPDALRMSSKREEFYGHPTVRDGILTQIEKDAKKLEDDQRRVHLCFTCDPYQPLNDETNLTRQAIQILKAYGMNFQVLTKSYWAKADFDLYTKKDWFGMSLTFYGDNLSEKWEPNASQPNLRLYTLMTAKEKGINTWASMEPVIDPFETLTLISMAYDSVDYFMVGKLNSPSLEKELKIDWKWFAYEAVNLLERLGCDYYIKKDLQPYLPDGAPVRKGDKW